MREFFRILGWVILITLAIIPNLEAEEISPLAIAQSQIGLGEIGGNNKGAYVRQYLNGQENLPWCAGFISYCLHKAGYKIPYYLRAKSYLEASEKVYRWNLQAGDLVIFNRKGGGHIGIIEKVVHNGFTSIEGNLGSYPARVKRVHHIFQDESIIKFVRLIKKCPVKARKLK